MTSTPPLLSVVLSFRNEQDVLVSFIDRIRSVLIDQERSGFIKNWELVFVNDASDDRSLSILLEQSKGHQDIRIINMSRTFGVGPCVMAGLAHARGDLVVYMDCDLQDPPELIGEMIASWREGHHVDVVHTLRKRRHGEGSFKLFITGIGYWILNRYSTVPIPREAGDFKLLTRRVVNHLLKFKEHKPFMRGLVSWVGFHQAFVSYERQARHAGKSKFFVLSKKVISNFLNSALVNFSSVPLQLATYCGIFALLVTVGVMIHALIQKLSGQAVPGWTALNVVVLFIGVVQLFCIGTIGLYLNSVHEQTKQRPNYIVASTYGFKDDVNA